MSGGAYRFDAFQLDLANRRLTREGRPVELNARYLDALALLVREHGRLVSKDRFHEEVWRGIPVTDEALTQCIRTLRRQLGDEAGRPRFIETVPKHGYRFIGPVEIGAAEGRVPAAALPDGWRLIARLAGAGTIGGGVAGLLGGLFYGFVGAFLALQPGAGAASAVLVIVVLAMAIALLGAAGVSVGIAATAHRGPWTIAGAALGGLVVGALVKLLGLDALALLFGQAPSDMTGAPEGAALGGAVGLGAWLAMRGSFSVRRGVAIAAIPGALAGAAIPLLGGRLMAGSLDLLADAFPGSRLRLDRIGALMGEAGFGPLSHVITGSLEGLLFAACVVGAMLVARRRP